MKKKVISMVLVGCLAVVGLTGCSSTKKTTETKMTEEIKDSMKETKKEEAKKETTGETVKLQDEKEQVTIMVAAAVSLKNSFEEELIPMFQQKYPNVKVEGVYDASGKLQTQIEEGLEADIFISAATKQMDALVEGNKVSKDSVVDLLENKIVLIVPAGSKSSIKSFEDVEKAGTVAIGDPESVPVGQYSQEALTSLGVWDKIQDKISKGTNVTEVLNWVAAGSADVGIVYATDAASTKDVEIVAEAPEGSLAKKVIYPVGLIATSKHGKEAKDLEEFLSSKEALEVFEKYGFTPNK